MALSMRLATACTTSCRLPRVLRAVRDVHGERHAALLGDRLVQLGDVAHEPAEIEALGVAFERRRLPSARIEQQALKVLMQLVGLLDRVLEASR